MGKNTLYYQEVFSSIQGESTDAGLPCVFVRLYGCNLKCSYCDTKQTQEDRKKITIENLNNLIRPYGIPYVCFTGGEPLLQWSTVYVAILELLEKNYKVSVETNGCVPIEPDPYLRSFKYVMDIKCPSSNMSHMNIYNNLMNLQAHDEVKFVIWDEEDYKFMRKILNTYSTPAKILVSPCFDAENELRVGSQLVDWLLRDRLYNVRVQCQLHKVLGVR